MEVKDLKSLLEAVAKAELSEFTLETGDYKITLKRGSLMLQSSLSQPAVVAPPANPAPVAVTETLVASAKELEAAATSASSRLVEVTAPIVGTFYAASAPDDPPFIKLGDRVKTGTVLCIIEAMKLMNEIEAEVSGTVVEILVKNEDPVEYGQALFRIEPS